MASSSPLLHYPTTPAHHRTYIYGHQPIHSSPLASPAAPTSSPLASATLRRRSQYKTHTGSTQPRRTQPGSCPPMSSAVLFGGVGGTGRRTMVPDASQPQGSILREKFKARCFERASKAKQKAVASRRFGGSEAGSDGPDEMMDDETGNAYEDMMQDELFRRIMENAGRKSRHSYRLSYEHEVGSSFDPDMEDVDRWEEIMGTSSSCAPPMSHPPSDLEEIFEELEEEELRAYAEECAKRAALADFEDITAEELSNLSDFEEEAPMAHDEDGDTQMN